MGEVIGLLCPICNRYQGFGRYTRKETMDMLRNGSPFTCLDCILVSCLEKIIKEKESQTEGNV